MILYFKYYIMQVLEFLQKTDKDNLKEVILTLTEEQEEELNKLKAISINWHSYTWKNLYTILAFKWPWIYGTFPQWRKEKRKVKKGAKWIPIQTPIFWDKEKESIRFFKTTYIFHKEDTE